VRALAPSPLAGAASIDFARAARRLSDAARAVGLTPPDFRSPPAAPGARRTLRRRPDGGAVVAVRLRGRPWPAVLADMIDGVLAANPVDGPAADVARDALWKAVEASTSVAA